MSNKRQIREQKAESRRNASMVSRYAEGDCRLVKVFVEGYDDVAFWRGVFDEHQTADLKFEVSVPPREDLAKGKRVLLEMIERSSEDVILCVDSDFDYIFDGCNDQSKLVMGSSYLFHTYAYATENYLCYPPSLHHVCAKATKNDTYIFDFEKFMADYSKAIYPLFLWYAYCAKEKEEKAFSLTDFRSSVRLNYLDINDDGAETVAWLSRQVEKRLHTLKAHHREWVGDVSHFAEGIARLGVTPENVYMYMQGHTLMDNVVMTVLRSVCDALRDMTLQRIASGTKFGVALKNELSNYNNALRNVREVLLDNEHYKSSPQYKLLQQDIRNYIKNLK